MNEDNLRTISSINEVLAMPLALSLPRIAAALFVLGILPKTVPLIARSALAVALAIFVHPVVSDQLFTVDEDASFGSYLPIVLKEALIGMLIGLTFALPLRIFETVGGIIDFQSGASTGAIMDPITNTEVGPYGRLLLQVAIVLFMVSGGLLAMVRLLAESFRAWPVMRYYPSIGEPLREFAVKYGVTLLTYAIVIGMSVALLLLVIELGIGFINRITPQLNVFSFAMGIKSILAALTLLALLPFAYDGLKSYFNGTVHDLQELDQAMAAGARKGGEAASGPVTRPEPPVAPAASTPR